LECMSQSSLFLEQHQDHRKAIKDIEDEVAGFKRIVNDEL